MFEIQTFTAHADFAEDRIRLDIASAGGEIQSIWLTQRLANRFLPVLVRLVEEQEQPAPHRDIGLAMSQQELRLQRSESPEPDVEAPPDSANWLCRTIHLEKRGEELVWTLTDDAESTAAMGLTSIGARSVLEVFLLMYRRLEWDLDIFPEWLMEEDATPKSPARTLN